MKFGFSTLGCPEWELEKILAYAASENFSVELRGIKQNVNIADMPELTDENLPKTRTLAVKYGVEFSCVDTSANFNADTPHEKAMTEGYAGINAAKMLGARFIRVFGDRIVTGDDGTAAVKRVADGVRELCDRAANKNIGVLLETHGDFNTADRILAVEKAVERDNFGIIWDIEHTKCDLAEFYEKTRHIVRQVHLKESRTVPLGTKLVLPARGGTMDEAYSILERYGFDGVCSLEWEKRWQPDSEPPEVAFPAFAKWIRSVTKK